MIHYKHVFINLCSTLCSLAGPFFAFWQWFLMPCSSLCDFVMQLYQVKVGVLLTKLRMLILKNLNVSHDPDVLSERSVWSVQRYQFVYDISNKIWILIEEERQFRGEWHELGVIWALKNLSTYRTNSTKCGCSPEIGLTDDYWIIGIVYIGIQTNRKILRNQLTGW